MVIKTLKIEVKEVSWTDGIANKWQAFAAFINPETEKVERRIIGDPATSEAMAMKMLYLEANEWNEISSQLLDYFEEERKKR